MLTNRRDLILASLGGAAIASIPDYRSLAQDPKPGNHAVKPLPFDPTKLPGLSERLLVSHHDNNYAGAVKNLNKVEAELAGTNKDTPAFLVAGLRERELTFRNSAALHELYFGNLGGDGKAAGGISDALATSFGSMARFEELFRATGMSLAGGSGWTVLAYDLHRDSLAIAWAGGHTQALAAGLPLLVLDMYEHSYHLDYGASAAKYVDAFFANLAWQAVDARLAAARKAAAALRG
jgi:Fe-Mn family superoxide dismutase